MKEPDQRNKYENDQPALGFAWAKEGVLAFGLVNRPLIAHEGFLKTNALCLSYYITVWSC